MKTGKNNLNLIIFPGGGSPNNKLYKNVYALLSTSAKNYGYKKVDTSVIYPGHIDSAGHVNAKLTLDGAIEVAYLKVKEYDEKGLKYDILGRSFGTIVAVKIATDKKLNHLRKIILWGPPPYWLIWQMFSRDLKENIKIAKTKGLHIDKKFFLSAKPIESMLQSLEYPTVIATGTKDPYSKPFYINYLWNCVAHKTNFHFRVIEDAPHEVTKEKCSPEVVTAYLECLFKNNF